MSSRQRLCAEVSEGRRGPVYSFRGSEFGGCLHSQVIALRMSKSNQSLTTSPPPKLQQIFDYGHAEEMWMKKHLISLGVKFTEKSMSNRWDEQESASLSKGMGEKGFLVLRCSLDGITEGFGWELLDHISNLPDERVPVKVETILGLDYHKANNYDHKALGDAAFEKFLELGIEAFPRYSWQFSAGCHGLMRERPELGKVGLLVTASHRPKPREDGVIYKEDSKGWALAYYSEPPFSAEQCLSRCESVVDLFLRGECPKCDSEYPCRYPKPEPSSLEEEDVVKLLSDYSLAVDEIDYWTRRRESLEPIVGDEFSKRGDFRAGNLGVSGFRKSWRLVKYEEK